MEDLHQQIRDSQKALLARVHHVQFLFLDGFEKLVSLNLQAVRGRLDEAVDRVKTSDTQSGEPDPLAQFAQRVRHQFDHHLAYGRQLGEIIEGLQSGLHKLTLTELDRDQPPAIVAPSRTRPVIKRSTRQTVKSAVRDAQSGAKPVAAAAAPTKEKAAKAPSRTKRQAASHPRSAKPPVMSKPDKGLPTAKAVAKTAAKRGAPAVKPVVRPAAAVTRQPAVAPVTSVAAPQPTTAAAARKPAQAPVNVIGHLVAQTTPEGSEKDSSQS